MWRPARSGRACRSASASALAGKYLDKLPYRVWVAAGRQRDGRRLDLGGVRAWRGYYKLNNLIAILDMNRLGQRGQTMLGWNGDAYAARARAFGWHAIEIDGHDLDADRPRLRRGDAQRPTQPTLIVAQHRSRARAFSEIENKDGWHGKALPAGHGEARHRGAGRRAPPHRAASSKPEPRQPRQRRRRTSRVQLPKYENGDNGRDAPGLWRRAQGARRGTRRRRRARRRGEQLDLRRELREGLSRTASSRCTSPSSSWSPSAVGLAGARLHAVRLDLRRLLHARLRLHPHGGDLARQHPPLRLARGRLDRRGRPVADGAGRPGDDARGPRQHGALPQRRATRRRSWSQQMADQPGHRLPADDARERRR